MDDNTSYITVDNISDLHCVKSVCIWSYSGPYSVQKWENADQNNSEYGYFSRSAYQTIGKSFDCFIPVV